MPAKDRHHEAVKLALAKDGWRVVSEQVKVIVDDRSLFIDLEIEQLSTGRALLIEVKELNDVDSPIEALANAVGKFILYRLALNDEGIDRELYVAVSENTYNGILAEKIGILAVSTMKIPLLVFDPVQQEVIQWIPNR